MARAEQTAKYVIGIYEAIMHVVVVVVCLFVLLSAKVDAVEKKEAENEKGT